MQFACCADGCHWSLVIHTRLLRAVTNLSEGFLVDIAGMNPEMVRLVSANGLAFGQIVRHRLT